MNARTRSMLGQLKPTASLLLLLTAGAAAGAAVHYVDQNSPNPTPPFIDWSTAATNIQDAVDAASAGALVLVKAGIYGSGRRLAADWTNRVVVTKPLTLQSVSGPDATLIQGSTGSDLDLARCVFLCSGAVLSGFTLTNGTTYGLWPGGGAYCESASALVTNCTLTHNYALSGAGAYRGTLINCILTGNSAKEDGGGAASATLNHCSFTGNSAVYGGGAYDCSLTNCSLIRNSVFLVWSNDRYPFPQGAGGGGACGGTLYNCVLVGNSALLGGGAYGGLLNSCVLASNSVKYVSFYDGNHYPPGYSYYGGNGGGAHLAALNNCTLTSNSAEITGGGAYNGTLTNCIVYYNTAPTDSNCAVGILNYCCTIPLPVIGSGNISDEPLFVDRQQGNFRLQENSPCINGGNNLYASGTTDLDGNPRVGGSFVDIGAYEFQGTGAPSIRRQPISQGVYEGDETQLTVSALGAEPLYYQWQLNGVAIQGATDFALQFPSVKFSQGGVYRAVVSNGLGSVTSAEARLAVLYRRSTTNYVWSDSPNPSPPYSNWVTAAHDVQTAVDLALGGSVVLVTNGVYSTGGRTVGADALTNRVVVDKPVTVRSVNGPGVTFITGYQVPGTTNGIGAVRCAYLAGGAVLDGFTLTGGACVDIQRSLYPGNGGGGAFCESTNEMLVNCTLAGNSANLGGGVYQGTLHNCVLVGNYAPWDWQWWDARGGGFWYRAGGYGGGSYRSALYNCTVTENRSPRGGGGCNSAFHNCVVYYNLGDTNLPYYDYRNYKDSSFYSSCTTPLPTNGAANISIEPGFLSRDGADFWLATNSPCINAGNNSYARGLTDLDGNARVVGSRVDMGAYEFQPGGLPFQFWLQFYELATDGSADYLDTDGDGHNNWEEWRCQTDPTSALSALRLLSATPAGNTVAVRWQSVAGVNYVLERSTNLASPFVPLAAGIPGQVGFTSFVDEDAVSTTPLFYRVRVRY